MKYRATVVARVSEGKPILAELKRRDMAVIMSGGAAVASIYAQSAGQYAAAAEADRQQTGEDRVATGEDRVATGQDKTAAAGSAALAQEWAVSETDVEPGFASARTSALAAQADRIQTGEDREQAGLDAAATAADRVQTGLDRDATAGAEAATAADRVATGLDAQATAADRVQTGLDRQQTTADATATAADRVATGQDASATAADRVQTGQDRTASAGHEAKAAEWATSANEVEPGLRSAKWYAESIAGDKDLAEAAADTATSKASEAAGSATAAEGFTSTADQRASDAEYWAQEAETAVTGMVEDTDPRLSDAREWTAATVGQAEAEAGTATTARKWTAQRVRQAIAAWWNGSAMKTKLDGIATGATANATDAQLRDRSTHTGAQAIATVTGLQGALDDKVPTSRTINGKLLDANISLSAADVGAPLPSQILGFGQVWQDLASSRVLGVTYTNTTDKPIVVVVSISMPGASCSLFVDDVRVAVGVENNNSFSSTVSHTAIVPAGVTYSATSGSGSLINWAELR